MLKVPTPVQAWLFHFDVVRLFHASCELVGFSVQTMHNIVFKRMFIFLKVQETFWPVEFALLCWGHLFVERMVCLPNSQVFKLSIQRIAFTKLLCSSLGDLFFFCIYKLLPPCNAGLGGDTDAVFVKDPSQFFQHFGNDQITFYLTHFGQPLLFKGLVRCLRYLSLDSLLLQYQSTNFFCLF